MSEHESAERPEDIEKDAGGVVRRWILELKLADKREDGWRKKAGKVWDRYRQKSVKQHSYNILWANTETLRPSVYNSLPSPDVRRRFKDEDPLGKAVSEVLGRALEYGLDTTDFDAQMKSCALDMLLPGRAVARVRYVPSLKQVLPDGAEHDEELEQHAEGEEALEGDNEEVEWEQVPIEHVQWDDFRISTGKEWSEVTWIAFRHRLTRDQLEEQFPDCGADVPLDSTDDDDVRSEQDTQVKEAFQTAEVWEIWDKEESEVLFISQGYKEKPLKTLDDPLRLVGFFPVPQPLYAILDSSSLNPVPLYEMYKEQAEELDTITKRINLLTRGLKMRGIYDATLTELSELMRGEDNDLIPADNVTALLERGGLEKAIWFLPIEQAARVLLILSQQRESSKQIIYEITGISDIVRGSSNPNETLGAQQIKATFGGLRINNLKGEVARFIRDLIRLQAEIIGEHFSPETLATMTGKKYPTGAEKQQAEMQYQQAMMQYQQMAMQAQQQGQKPPPPPPKPELPPSWDEIMQVLRDDKMRTFKVDIETDSTVAASIESDMQGLKDVLGALTQITQGFAPMVQAGMLPVEAMKEIMLAVTRRAKMGNAVEDAFDKMKQPPPQQPEQQAQDNSLQVEQMRQQGEAQKLQATQQHDAQLEQLRLGHAAQLEQARMANEAQAKVMAEQAETQREQIRIEAEDRWKSLEAETRVLVAQIAAESSEKQSAMSAQQVAPDSEEPTESAEPDTNGALAVAIQGFQAALEQMNRPKTIIRGPDGRVAGVQ